MTSDAGAGGVVPRLWSPAAAPTGPRPEASTEVGTDSFLLRFAESVELAAVAGYQKLASSGGVISDALAATLTNAEHHKKHAASLGAMAGDRRQTVANPTLADGLSSLFGAAFGRDAQLQVAFRLENALAATYLYLLGALTGSAALGLSASILPVESQHAAELAHLLGMSTGSAATYLPTFLSTDAAVEPDKYPLAPGT